MHLVSSSVKAIGSSRTCAVPMMRHRSATTDAVSSAKGTKGKLASPRKKFNTSKNLLDPSLDGADPVICLQNAIKLVIPWAAHKSLDACIQKDLNTLESDEEKKGTGDLLLNRLAPNEVSSAFMLLHSNRFEFGKQKTTVEAETLRLAQGVSTILEGGLRNPETYIRANTAGVSAKFKSGKLSEGYKAAADLYFKAKQLKGSPKDMSLVLTAAIRGLSTHGKVEHAAALLEKMIEQYSLAATSNTVMHLFKNLGYMGKVNEAVALFELMKERNVQLDERMLAGIIHGYAHERKISAASKYFNEITRLGLTVGTESYEGMIRAHALRLQPADALQTFRNLRSDGLPASTGILADLTRVYGATGDLTNAIKFFNKNENVRGFRQGADMVSAAVDAFAFNGELVSAWRQANIGVEKIGAFQFLTPVHLRGLSIVHASLDAGAVATTLANAGIKASHRPAFAVTLARALLSDVTTSGELEEARDIPILPSGSARPDIRVAAEKALAILSEITSEKGALNPSTGADVTASLVHPKVVLGRAFDATIAAHNALGNYDQAISAFESFEKTKTPVIRKACEHLLAAGSAKKDKAVVSMAVQLLRSRGDLSAGAIENLIRSTGMAVGGGKIVGSDTAETGVGKVSEVVQSWVAEGGVPSARQPVLSAYIEKRKLNLLMDNI